MAFGHSFGPSGLLDFVFHALRALKPCFVACEGRWVKNVTERRNSILYGWDEQGSEKSGSADGGKSRNQKDSVGSKCAENSGPGMRFTRSQRCILLSLTAPTPDIGFHTEGISSEVETSASTPTHSLVSPCATSSSSQGFPFLFHLQEKKIRDTQSSNGEPFGKISIFGFMAWLSLGKKFPGITLVGGDQVPGRGDNGPFISWSPQIAPYAALHPVSPAPNAVTSSNWFLKMPKILFLQ